MMPVRLVALAAASSFAVVAFVGSAAAPAGAASASPTCKQITKAQVQPLLSGTITNVKVTKAGTGQQCVYSSPHNEAAIDLLVMSGAQAKSGYRAEVATFDHKVAVPGVGTSAYRDTDDDQIVALKGDVYCSVSLGAADSVTGVGPLEEANGGDVPESYDTAIARALGTLCNRIYGRGSTTPQLSWITAGATTTK